MTVVVSLFCVLLFYDVGSDVPGVQTRNGALFFITMNQAMSAVQNIILVFPDERAVFLREVNNEMYTVSAYFFAKVISEYPMGILSPVLFGCIEYWAIGFNSQEWYKFPAHLGLLTLLYNTSGSYALILGTLFSDKQLAVTLTPVLVIPFALFSGFFLNSNQIPRYLIPFEYASLFKYGYQSMFLNEYTDLYLECMDDTGPARCDPLSQANMPQTLTESALSLVALYFGCLTIALLIMKSMSNVYE